jgi:hypothetical protein
LDGRFGQNEVTGEKRLHVIRAVLHHPGYLQIGWAVTGSPLLPEIAEGDAVEAGNITLRQ